jgi:hypothetical protein
LRKTVGPSSTDGTRYVILATDEEVCAGRRTVVRVLQDVDRSVFDVEDDVVAADAAAGRPEFRIP